MKSVIIAGASRGIGYDTALVFGRAGYEVFATMRNPDRATALKQKINDESLPITLLKMDVNSDTSVAGQISNTPLTSYATSKFALEALSEGLAQEVKPFNIRVGVVEPGIINTDMAKDISQGEAISNYPQSHRFGGLFRASLKTPTEATLVADKIFEVAESDTWILRHPVGPDAIPFLEWRKSLTDEEWIDWHAMEDDAWYKAVEKDFGLDARSID